MKRSEIEENLRECPSIPFHFIEATIPLKYNGWQARRYCLAEHQLDVTRAIEPNQTPATAPVLLQKVGRFQRGLFEFRDSLRFL